MVSRRQDSRSVWATPLCRIVLLAPACLVLSTAAGASAPNDEATLVKEAVEGGVLAARIAAAQGRERAAGVAAPTLGNPVLEARHEQANGPAGASTDLLGGSIALAWGGVAEAQAATRREQAA